MQEFINPTSRNRVANVAAPCGVLFVVCSYLFGISRGIDIARMMYHLLADDVWFSPVGKSIVRPLVEKSQIISGKRSLLAWAAIVVAVLFLTLEYSSIFLFRKSSEMQLEKKIKTKASRLRFLLLIRNNFYSVLIFSYLFHFHNLYTMNELIKVRTFLMFHLKVKKT